MDSSFTQKEAHGLFKPSVTVILLETGKQKEVFMDILCISAEYQLHGKTKVCEVWYYQLQKLNT